ncbi:MAG TPA: glycosyltransferase [Opitutaceae bacterium]|nr:glycosyltransferase [Opitutaceae bacterium]
MQRVRLNLPYLRQHDWEPVVLALEPDMVEGGVIDPMLANTYPCDIQVVRIRGISPRYTRKFGVGNLWWRCGRALTKAGDELMRKEKFDLVFISTTQFSAFQLGPRWKRKFGVPYVLDYQDPWINPYYRRTNTRPPGGPIKFALSQWAARRIEPRALRGASGVIAVSDAYGKGLAESYPWFDAQKVKLLPFGASSSDFSALGSYRPAQPLVNFDDECFHHVYTGRCGPDMSFAMCVLFRAFKRFLISHPAEAEKTRFHFIGTDYAPPPLGREWAMPAAVTEGVERYVHEHCYRVPYFDALYYLKRANALVGVGSNDPTYAASKIFPYILAERPMVLIYHQTSLVLTFSKRMSVGARFSFHGPQDIDSLADMVHREWFVSRKRYTYEPYNRPAFEPFTAATLTTQLADIFNDAIKSKL